MPEQQKSHVISRVKHEQAVDALQETIQELQADSARLDSMAAEIERLKVENAAYRQNLSDANVRYEVTAEALKKAETDTKVLAYPKVLYECYGPTIADMRVHEIRTPDEEALKRRDVRLFEGGEEALAAWRADHEDEAAAE